MLKHSPSISTGSSSTQTDSLCVRSDNSDNFVDDERIMISIRTRQSKVK